MQGELTGSFRQARRDKEKTENIAGGVFQGLSRFRRGFRRLKFGGINPQEQLGLFGTSSADFSSSFGCQRGKRAAFRLCLVPATSTYPDTPSVAALASKPESNSFSTLSPRI
jgi:hypothetical protein